MNDPASSTKPPDAAAKEVEEETSILLDVVDVARLLRCSSRTVRRVAEAGRMPKPVRIGRLLRWNREQICEWVHQGCPE